ncbi:MAG: alpha/beta hydrolase [Methylobacter sp.]
MSEQSILKALRKSNTKNAIVFVHGFGGDSSVTWGSFPDFLMATPSLDGWDIYSLGYSSKLAPDFRGIWSGNPSIETIANYLYTRAYVGELERYNALVFIAHSMGGLAVQRALLDYNDLLRRTTHVFLFGTPSNGLQKAGWLKWFKRQVEDMAANGEFVHKLRKDWGTPWPKEPPPRFWAIAGDSDEFVPASSSLGPFPREQRLVVPGNHLEIVKPKEKDDLSVQVIVCGIQGEAAPAGPWNAARVALQMLDFREAVDALEVHASELDDMHLVQLAIAIEGLGDSDKALAVLESAGRRGTDARGVLAGRLKRRWITEGREDDYKRALELYTSAYEEAAGNNDHPQAFYHGINVCFLLSAGSSEKAAVSDMAGKVLEHCNQAPKDFWCLGTEGEAKLYLRMKGEALTAYRNAVSVKPVPEPWQLKSMHSQASQLAAFLNNDDLLPELDKIFRQEQNPE